MSEILVLVEHADGELKKATKELLSAAAKIGEPSAIVIDVPGTTDKLEKDLANAGAIKIYRAESEIASQFHLTPKIDVIASLVESKTPAAVIISASIEGKEIAGRVAARLGSGTLTDVVDIKEDLIGVHSIFGGSYTVDAKVVTGVPIFTIRAGAVDIDVSPVDTSVEDVELVEPDLGAVKQISFTPAVGGDRPGLTEASIVVSGGRGVGSEDKFHEVIEPLADALGAAVGASRAAVDSGYYPGKFQVGQTGVTVSPQLYVAMGISGAIQHLAGMQTSKTIVAVNTADDVPIFDIADYSVIGDLFEVAPQLTEAVKKHKG